MNVVHVTWLKRLVNVPLRFLQRPFTDRPFLLASVFDVHADGTAVWTGRYAFCRVQLRRPA